MVHKQHLSTHVLKAIIPTDGVDLSFRKEFLETGVRGSFRLRLFQKLSFSVKHLHVYSYKKCGRTLILFLKNQALRCMISQQASAH